ncbi:MAG: hypothetical protein R6T91_04755 [Bacteroidales bacterium]
MLLSIYSCSKDNNQISNSREKFLGYYLGEDTSSMGSWTISNFSIEESPNGDNKVLINGLTRYEVVEGYVTDQNIYFDEQSFPVDYYSPGGAHVEYTATYSGSGKLDTTDMSIIIDHFEKQAYTDTAYTIEWITVADKQ